MSAVGLRPTAIRAMHAQRGAFRSTIIARSGVKPEFQPHLSRFTRENISKWIPTFAFWGAAAGGAVVMFLSPVPVFQRDILLKIPILSKYFEDKTPDSDKPF